MSFADWIHYLSVQLSEDDFHKASCMMWFVWYNRNLKWHGEDSLDVRTISLKIQAFLKRGHSWRSVYTISNQVNATHWLPPMQGYTKINCDGSWAVANRTAGVGIICRVEENTVIAAQSVFFTRVAHSYEAEGLAIRQGMQLANELGLKKVIFETDCTKVAEALWFGRHNRSDSEHSQWISWCAEELATNKFWQVSLIRREANMAADFAANHARVTGSSATAINSCPRFLGSCF